MFQGASCPIQFPDDEGVSWPRIGQRFIQAFALGFCTRDLVHKPFFATSLFQCINLASLAR